MYDPYYDLDVKEALNRLPREIVDARNQRLKRAMDLSLKHVYLPEDLQVFSFSHHFFIHQCVFWCLVYDMILEYYHLSFSCLYYWCWFTSYGESLNILDTLDFILIMDSCILVVVLCLVVMILKINIEQNVELTIWLFAFVMVWASFCVYIAYINLHKNCDMPMREYFLPNLHCA